MKLRTVKNTDRILRNELIKGDIVSYSKLYRFGKESTLISQVVQIRKYQNGRVSVLLDSGDVLTELITYRGVNKFIYECHS